MPFNEGADPYIWLENLEDPKVIEWVTARDAEARSALAPISKGLRSRIETYYGIPLVISLEASRRGVFALIREEGEYKVKLIHRDGSLQDLVDSRDLGEEILIKYVHPDLSGDRYALNYSYAGSDKGYTDLIDADSGEKLDQLEGVTNDVTWLGDDLYYYVRSYRETATPDGVEPPTNRVFLRDGDPEDPEDAKFLSRYSPYHNVGRGAGYPPTFLFTGLHDDRVHPAHALKFAALLEDYGHKSLLRVETKSGHAGAAPETKSAEESDVMAFVYRSLGLSGDD